MKFSLQVGKFNLSLGASRFNASTIQRAASSPIQAWLRGEDWTTADPHPFVSPFQQSVWVYTAISALAQTISAIPFRISQGDRSGENILSTGPLVDLFNRPHPYLNRFRFWEFIVTWYCLRGEAFILALDQAGHVLPINSHALTVSRSPRLPASLLVLSPDHFRHLIENSDLIGWRFTGSPLSTPLASMDLAPEDVIHDFFPNPYLFWRGMSPLSVAMLAAQTDYASAQFMKGVMLNNADTGVIVRTNQQISPEQREQIVASLHRRKNSAGTADRPLVLSEGFELVTPTLSSADMQFLDHRKCNRQEICAAFFRMPQSIIGFSEDANRAVAAQERLNFIENSITPLCVRLAAAVDPIVKSFGPDLVGWFDLDSIPILQEARRSRVDTGAKLFSLGYPVNAINKALDLGLPHLPWGDKGYLPTKVQEVGGGVAAPPPDRGGPSRSVFERMFSSLPSVPSVPSDQSSAQSAGERLRKAMRSKLGGFFFDQRRRVLAKLDGLAKHFTEANEGNEENGKSALECGDSSPLSPPGDLSPGRTRPASGILLDTHTPGSSTTTIRLPKAVTSRPRGRAALMLFWINRTPKFPAFSEMFNPIEETKLLLKKLTPLLQGALESGFAESIRPSSLPERSLPPERLASFLSEREAALQAVNETSFADLKASLQEGVEKGEKPDALAGRVKRLFQDASDHRAESIATTETEHAINAGRLFAMEEGKAGERERETGSPPPSDFGATRT